MKTVQFLSPASENSTVIPMRFVAVSATIPNAEDVSLSDFFFITIEIFCHFNLRGN